MRMKKVSERRILGQKSNVAAKECQKLRHKTWKSYDELIKQFVIRNVKRKILNGCPSFTFKVKEHVVKDIVNSFVKSGVKHVCLYSNDVDFKKGTIGITYEIERLSE